MDNYLHSHHPSQNNRPRLHLHPLHRSHLRHFHCSTPQKHHLQQRNRIQIQIQIRIPGKSIINEAILEEGHLSYSIRGAGPTTNNLPTALQEEIIRILIDGFHDRTPI